ncbi:MAG TPA: CdaR family protein [Candidatus Limnocylindria bacterium]|nr:CdaR family protein [Candidatus Limnocylindria bacterium]
MGGALASVRRGGLRRLDLRRAVTNDFPLKAAALGIAVIASVALAETSPPEVVAAYPGRVPVERAEVPLGYVLRGQLGDVSVRVRGSEQQIAKLGQPDLHASIDLAGVDLARNDLQDAPVRVILSDPSLAVAQIDPPTVQVRIERIVSRMLALQVRFANDPPPRYQAGTPAFSTSDVKVTGAQSLVGTVAAIFATIRFGDTPVDIASSAQAVAVDAAGNAVDGVQVDPAAVQVTVPVLPTASTRTVPVRWTIKGAVGAGYWISRVTTDPPAVTIQGGQSALAGVEQLDTAAIDVSGLTADRSFRVGLALPDGVRLLQPTDAVVGVTVVPLSGTRPFPLVAVQVINAGAGLAGETEAKTIEVVVSGPVAALQALQPDAVTATVDAAGRAAGTSTADVTVRVPAGLTVASVQPPRLTLTMRAK